MASIRHCVSQIQEHRNNTINKNKNNIVADISPDLQSLIVSTYITIQNEMVTAVPKNMKNNRANGQEGSVMELLKMRRLNIIYERYINGEPVSENWKIA